MNQDWQNTQPVTPFTLSGRLYIDNNDAYTTYGVWVVGGLESLIQWPKLKAVDENNWQESDGVEADLAAPVLDGRELTLKLAMAECTVGRYTTFINFLKSSVYHLFDFQSLGLAYSLRLVSYPSFDMLQGLATFEIRFSEDNPMAAYTYQAPSSTVASSDEYEIDGTQLTYYGVRVLKGSLDDIRRQGAIKEALKRASKYTAGVSYDGSATNRYKSRDVKLKCLMRAATLGELWECWDALLYNLIQPGERVLYCKHMDNTPSGTIVLPRPGEYKCYYKSCSVTKFYPTDKIWLEFTLTLCFTYSPISTSPIS